MNITQLKQRIIDVHNQIITNARAMFPTYANAPEPSVYFFETGRSAGLANGHRKIGYNIHVFAQDAERFINSTIAHEIAHAVCSYCRYDKGHGRNWKRVCQALGGNGQRCYDGSDIRIKSARYRKRYEYRTDGGDSTYVSDIIHGRIQHGKVYTLHTGRPPLNRLTRAHFTGNVA